MRKQIQSVAFAACIARLLQIGIVFFFAMPTAQAKQCSAALPSNPQGHWSYRFIDGRKCWYQGENMVSKSLLRWPAQAPARLDSDGTPVGRLVEKPDDLFDPDACCWPVLNDTDSFEARWRAVMGKN
jgi:hypothetical protein